MITKILLTLLVIVAALAYARRKRAPVTRHSSGGMVGTKSSRTPLYAALAFASLTLAISGLIFYQHWRERHTIFNVQVINSHTGEQQTYQAYREDIAKRSFRTVDGRQVNLADVERMEVQE